MALSPLLENSAHCHSLTQPRVARRNGTATSTAVTHIRNPGNAITTTSAGGREVHKLALVTRSQDMSVSSIEVNITAKATARTDDRATGPATAQLSGLALKTPNISIPTARTITTSISVKEILIAIGPEFRVQDAVILIRAEAASTDVGCSMFNIPAWSRTAAIGLVKSASHPATTTTLDAGCFTNTTRVYTTPVVTGTETLARHGAPGTEAPVFIAASPHLGNLVPWGVERTGEVRPAASSKFPPENFADHSSVSKI